MAVSGLPEPCSTHARDIARLALDMMDRSKSASFDNDPVVICQQYQDKLLVLIVF